MCKFLCRHVFSSFGWVPRSKIAGLYGKSIFSFVRNCQTVVQSGCVICLPASKSCCSTSSPAFNVVVILDFSYSDRCVVVLIYIFLIPYDGESSFHVFIYHLYIFFGEVSVKVFGPFFKLDCLFYYCWVLRILCIFCITFFYQIYDL